MVPPRCAYCQALKDGTPQGEALEKHGVCEACVVKTMGHKVVPCKHDDAEHTEYEREEWGALDMADAEVGGGAEDAGQLEGGHSVPLPKVPEGIYPGWTTRVSRGFQNTDNVSC